MKELSLQLYSARHTDTSQALELIAAAGYQGVETYGDNMRDKTSFEAALKNSGLKVKSMHIGFDQLSNNMALCLEEAEQFAASHLVCPYLMDDERPNNVAGWLGLVDKLAAIAEKVIAAGHQFAWHNHDFEFVALEDGRMPMSILLEAIPQMHWEIDIGWIQRAGLEPQRWLSENQARVSAVHLKDVALSGECQDEDGWADVGYGQVNWASLVTTLKSMNQAHWIVEHDNPSDLNRFVTQSITTIKGW